jgi:hypothetical protein
MRESVTPEVASAQAAHFDFCAPPRQPLRMTSPGPGKTGNVIAALCSFFIPGLGQLLQGRILAALVQFILAGILWYFLLGWLVHLWSVIDAAIYRGR